MDGKSPGRGVGVAGGRQQCRSSWPISGPSRKRKLAMDGAERISVKWAGDAGRVVVVVGEGDSSDVL